MIRHNLWRNIIFSANRIHNQNLRTAALSFIWGIRILVSIFLGAIIYTIIGNIIPGIRESMPNFFSLIDIITGTFENMVYEILHPWFLN